MNPVARGPLDLAFLCHDQQRAPEPRGRPRRPGSSQSCGEAWGPFGDLYGAPTTHAAARGNGTQPGLTTFRSTPSISAR